MTTLTIQISDKDRDLFEKILKRLDVKILEVVDDKLHPNSVSKKAISEARSGKTKKIGDLDIFFKRI